MAVFRVEKTKDYTVMSNHHLRNKALSLKAKGLISLMLSLPDNWDYTTRGLSKICKDGVDSIGSTLKELEKYGYLTREQSRKNSGHFSNITYIVHENPADSPCTEKPLQLNTNQLNTNISNNHLLNINQSINQYSEIKKEIDKIDVYKKIIHKNIDYNFLIERFSRTKIDEIVDLILEILLTGKKHIRISSDNVNAELVKSRMLKLNIFHIEYIFECMEKNTSKIHNIKNYLLTALYNAPATIDNYYSAEVQHDMFNGLERR